MRRRRGALVINCLYHVKKINNKHVSKIIKNTFIYKFNGIKDTIIQNSNESDTAEVMAEIKEKRSRIRIGTFLFF